MLSILAVLGLLNVLEAPSDSGIGGGQNKAAAQVDACGVVTVVRCEQLPHGGRAAYLDLDSHILDRREASIIIPATGQSALAERLDDRFLWRRVCAKGRTRIEDNRRVLSVEALDDVRIDKEPAQAPPPFGQGAFTLCQADVSAPTVVHEVRPGYTQGALQKVLEGVVLLEAVVLPDGKAGDIRVLKSLDRVYGLDDRAVSALREWRFAPGHRDGQPVPVIVCVEMTFKVRQ
jgi:TonB family protein